VYTTYRQTYRCCVGEVAGYEWCGPEMRREIETVRQYLPTHGIHHSQRSKVKVKQSRYRPGVAQRVPES